MTGVALVALGFSVAGARRAFAQGRARARSSWRGPLNAGMAVCFFVNLLLMCLTQGGGWPERILSDSFQAAMAAGLLISVVALAAWLAGRAGRSPRRAWTRGTPPRPRGMR